MISMIYVTCENPEQAKHISESLLGERLIGCANVLPQMTSYYRWDSEIKEEREVVLLLKTKSGLVEKTLEKILEIHPYDTPCALEITVPRGLEKYVNWIEQETQ